MVERETTSAWSELAQNVDQVDQEANAKGRRVHHVEMSAHEVNKAADGVAMSVYSFAARVGDLAAESARRDDDWVLGSVFRCD